ncbi:serine hydrolase domain-containing protein [Aspergillus affinis]|uniref:serine hydrolase domain-containing protein n=1 Tax=Aspergillus affinis TaxID=1070780 RepID=UPI0022FED181|nr:beta-lactamase [Aspergillus affinis]KAI9044508.1 beta-lactamase [Aspergillus affinis]
MSHSNNHPDQVKGTWEPEFKGLCDILEKKIANETEVGASITVNVDGKNVVDIWGGYRDEARSEAWEENTIVNVFSTTKNIVNLAMLILIDRGLLEPHAKVSKYWPEFAQNGKQDVKVRHLMSHTSGLAAWDEHMELSDLYDFESAAAKLAAQPPAWTPGTASGYQSLTQGFLLGKLVRQVTSLTLTEFVDKDIAAPLEADFQIGAKPSDWPRIANMIGYTLTTPSDLDTKSVAYKCLNNPMFPFEMANTPEWRNAELGSCNGHGNARSVARILSAISTGGEVDGIRLLKPETIDLIFQEQAMGTDLVLAFPFRFGMGFALTAPDIWPPYLPSNGRVCWWAGAGGSIGVMDLDRRMTIAYTPNKMQALGPAGEYVECIYKILGGRTPSLI